MRIVIECSKENLLEPGLTDFGCIRNEIIKDVERAVSAHLCSIEGDITIIEDPNVPIRIEVSNKRVGSYTGEPIVKDTKEQIEEDALKAEFETWEQDVGDR